MKTWKKTLIGLSTILAAHTAEAQDFFNGMPGPRLMQSDSYVSVDTKAGTLNGTYIEKIFPTIGTNTKLLTALPIGISEQGIDIKGINVGVMQQKIFGKELYGCAAAGAFKNNNGYLTNLTPQMYFTLLAKGFSVDLEGKVNLDLETGNRTEDGALTLGYGNERIRGGAYGKLERGNAPEYGGLVRFDITKNHQFWIEAYFNDRKEAKIRVACNF